MQRKRIWTGAAGVGAAGLRRGVLALLVAFVASGEAWASPFLFLDIGGDGPDGMVGVGVSKQVEILMSEVPPGSDGRGLFGFGFSITYDTAGIEISDLEFGPLFDGTGFDDTRDDPGNAGLTSNRFFQASGPFGDDILVATVVVTGLEEGTFALTLDPFSGVGDNVLFDNSVLDADPDFFQDGSIIVTPEPGSLALLGAVALPALVHRRWRATRGRRAPRAGASAAPAP